MSRNTFISVFRQQKPISNYIFTSCVNLRAIHKCNQIAEHIMYVCACVKTSLIAICGTSFPLCVSFRIHFVLTRWSGVSFVNFVCARQKFTIAIRYLSLPAPCRLLSLCCFLCSSKHYDKDACIFLHDK